MPWSGMMWVPSADYIWQSKCAHVSLVWYGGWVIEIWCKGEWKTCEKQMKMGLDRSPKPHFKQTGGQNTWEGQVAEKVRLPCSDSQNAGNCFFTMWKFKIFWGWPPRPPLREGGFAPSRTYPLLAPPGLGLAFGQLTKTFSVNQQFWTFTLAYW